MFSKRNLSIGISLILSLSAVLAACSPVGMTTPEATREPAIQSPTSAPAVDSPTQTPEATQASAQEYTNPAFGFSLSYPAGYEVQSSFYHTVVFLAPQGSQGDRVRGFLSVELAGNQTAEWFAGQAQQGNANSGGEITSSVISLDGQTAYVLGNLPGQDLNRQVFVIYKGILYHLTLMPDNPQEDEAYRQMETLYAAITSSLRFLPERQDVPPVMSLYNMVDQLDQALTTRSADAILRTLGDEFAIWYQMPDGLNHEVLGRNEAVPAILDKQISQAPELAFKDDVEWPKVMNTPEPFNGLFPNENVTPVLVRGWGAQGGDQAVIFIARRSDGSLYWRGLFVPRGTLVP